MAVTITSSVIVSDSAQSDGRRWIFERHTNSTGSVYERQYLCVAEFDATAALAAYAALILAGMGAAEITDNLRSVATLGSLAVPTFVYSTVSDNVAALRAAYATATQLQSVMLGDYLSTLTNGQLQTAFGLTAGQVTTLRTNKLTPAANIAASIRASTGQ